MAKLPNGEETIPLLIIDGKMLSLKEIEKEYPDVYNNLTSESTKDINYYKKLLLSKEPTIEITNKLLIKRFEERMKQGRERTIHRFLTTISPTRQMIEMVKKTKIGKELIEAERGLLEWELRILKE